jgi:hypothetical protein
MITKYRKILNVVIIIDIIVISFASIYFLNHNSNHIPNLILSSKYEQACFLVPLIIIIGVPSAITTNLYFKFKYKSLDKNK